MKISFDVIRRMGACWERDDWQNAFGDLTEVDVTANNARQYAGSINWHWLAAELFTDAGVNKYNELIRRASERYYADRTRVRDEHPFPEGSSYSEQRRVHTGIYEERQRLLSAVREEFNHAYADGFFVVYADERERADSIIEWASKDSPEPGPHGATQYFYDHDETDDESDDYEDYGDDVITHDG